MALGYEYFYELIHNAKMADFISEYLQDTKRSIETATTEKDLAMAVFSHMGLLRLVAENYWFEPQIRFKAACAYYGKIGHVVNSKSQLPYTSGCYCFLNNDQILYVGTANQIRYRMQGRFAGCEEFGYVECDTPHRLSLELGLISLLSPAYNSQTRETIPDGIS